MLQEENSIEINRREQVIFILRTNVKKYAGCGYSGTPDKKNIGKILAM
jgi:hypothetical protein